LRSVEAIQDKYHDISKSGI